MTIFNNVFHNNQIIAHAMRATQMRNNIISHNIANVDVPGFSRSVLRFEDLLDRELTNAARENRAINLANATPETQVLEEGLRHRLDGNNVDIEAEMVALFQNSTRYEVMTMNVTNNFARITGVMMSNI
ncbi:MAG: flagellar basal body rod protein FlgB [Defluviitaleaceae bacterium]|nr:flagellar basal body rod protein FlgB [Defluviitaleaceae bacterium]